ncbi:transcriptional regulator (plasmid) [Natronorubrum aibiense]|uniref:Transcriptional regulator n=1 Tax=Natronorubrum aibiense TaxID=348826 RepID=A0A5P9P8W3_9EURY|nr:transcriptional regulator [Natronorubrum aibiense]
MVELLDRSPRADGGEPLPELTGDSAKGSEMMVTHNHLPRLAEADFIVWDQETDEVAKGPRFEEIRPLLELIDSHAGELPEEWI